MNILTHMASPPNILLLISDSFRYDNLFDRADMPVRTPYLDRFSQRAVSLTNLYAGSFPTIPHRTDLTSGRISWPWHPWQVLQKSTANNMPALLGQAGYVSQLICDCPHLFGAGFCSGFSAAHALRGQEGDLHLLRMNHQIAQTMPPDKTRMDHHFLGHNLPDLHRWQNAGWTTEEDCFAPRTANTVINWLEDNHKYNPFFAWVDMFDPHEPWDPPEEMVRHYDPDYDGCPMIHPNYGKASDLTPPELRNLRAHYCAESELVDSSIGHILQKLDDLDLWHNTIVVFTADHGTSLGEHNRTGKTNVNDNDDRYWPIYPEVAHIPMMIAAPGLPAGTSVDALLNPADILPTLMDLAGVQCQAPEPLHGQSFAPLLRGEQADLHRQITICACHGFMQDVKLKTCATTPVAYTDQWAYAPIGADGTPELFDLQDDPLAANDIASQRPEIVLEMHANMMRRLAELDVPPEVTTLLT